MNHGKTLNSFLSSNARSDLKMESRLERADLTMHESKTRSPRKHTDPYNSTHHNIMSKQMLQTSQKSINNDDKKSAVNIMNMTFNSRPGVKDYLNNLQEQKYMSPKKTNVP